MTLRKYTLGLCTIGILSIACSSDDTNTMPSSETGITAPTTYSFERNGSSSVSFGGQTTRIAMAEVLASALVNTTATKEQLNGIFNHQEGVADFEDETLNASNKSIKSKVAASKDFFATNQAVSADIKEQFDTWIAAQVDEVFPKWDSPAVAGTPGKIQEGGSNGSNRYVNANGLEYNQIVAKGLIGGLMTDQTLNNYLGKTVLDGDGNREDNDAGIVAEGKSYTNMEHKWDEAYGYVYGASADAANPNTTIGKDDNFLNKYIGRVENDSDFTGIAAEIYNAFKLGRAAIVAKDYAVRDAQAAIIRQKISEIIAIRAVYYLQQGKNTLDKETKDYATAFHDLSEGYGFIYSLQFTRKPSTKAPFFSTTEVTDLLEQLTKEENGLWNVTPATLDDISETIASKFDFTVAQAGS